MEPLALKLGILKGPRKGETLEYRPGSKIRIGRVVRGNNLPIKDSGISTNHLVIDSESGQWMVRDLGSSNGTIVNDTVLKPNTPFELSDGDEIKIGEYTSISVKIDGCEEASRLRRNPRRAAVGKVAAVASRCRRGRVAAESEVVQVEVKLEAVIENCEEISGGEDRAPGGRGRARKKNEVESDLEEIEVVEKPKRGRGRPPKKARVLNSDEDVVEEAAVPEVSSRAATRSKNVVPESENCSVECEQVVEPKRRGRKKKNVQEEQLVCEKGNAVVEEKDLGKAVAVGLSGDKGDVVEQEDSGEIGQVDDDKAKGSKFGVEPKRCGSKKKIVQEEQLVCEEGNAVAEDKDLREIVAAVVNCDDRGEVLEQKHSGEIGPVYDDDAKRLDLEDERHEEAAVGFDVGESVMDNEKAKESNLGHEEAEVDFGMVENGNDTEKAKESSLGHEEAAIDCSIGEGSDKVESGSRSCSGAHGATDVDKKGSGSGVKEGLGKIWQEEPDLEKMTLDDWFDYVEVSWPKAVNDEIEKICAGMREKARLVQEYIAQHKKEKGQS